MFVTLIAVLLVAMVASCLWAIRELRTMAGIVDQDDFNPRDSRRHRGRAFFAMGMFEVATGLSIFVTSLRYGDGFGGSGITVILLGLIFFAVAYLHRHWNAHR